MNGKFKWGVVSLIVAIISTTVFCASSDNIRINGYTSVEYERRVDGDAGGDKNGSFDADLFDIVLNVQSTPNLRIAADLTWEHGTATEDGHGNAAIEYAWPEYTFRPWLKIRAGKMFVHNGIYNEIHTAKPVMVSVKEPLATNKSDKFGSDLRFYPRWGIGVAALGSFLYGDLDYIVQLMNGDQEETNPFEEDNNRSKAMNTRVRYYLNETLRVGASYYTDMLKIGNTRIHSVGPQLEWEVTDEMKVELEGVYGIVDGKKDYLQKYAYTAMVSYMFMEKYTPYFRYEFLDPNLDISSDQAMLFVYGINISIDEGFYWKTDLNTVLAGDNNSSFDSKSKTYTELKTALVVGW